MHIAYQAIGVWEHFTVQDGLPDMKIECIFEDRSGVLWIGTHDRGVVRYEGGEFKSFSCRDGLSGEGVFSILEDRQGKLWLGTNQGLTVYDGRRFESVDMEMPGSFLWGSCVDQKGELWFGMERQPGRPPLVSHWNGKKLEQLEVAETTEAQGQSIHQVVCDNEGVLWIGGDGLYRCEDGRFECIVKGTDSIGQVQSLLICKDRSLWIASNNGLWEYAINPSSTLLKRANNYGLVSLSKDSTGILWLTTYDGKVLCHDGETTTLVRSLNTVLRSGLCWDKAGRLWVGTYGMGLYCYDYNRIRIFQEEQGLPSNSVLCLAEEKNTGILWIGTRKGLIGWSEQGFVSLDNYNISSDLEITGLLEDRFQRLWIGTRIGYLFISESRKVAPIPLSPKMERYRLGSLAEDHEGRIWFGFRYGKGFGYCEGTEIRYFLPQKEADYPTWIGAIEVDNQGRVWLGSASPAQWEGLCCYDGISFKKVGGIANSAILVLHKDREGYLWIGTSDGIKRYDGENYVSIGEDEELPCEIITAITQTEDGTIWFGTEGGGVYRYDGKVFQVIRIPGDQTRNVIHAIYQDTQKRIWVATEGGLVQYISHQLKPEVVVEEVSAGQKYAMPSEVQIPTTVPKIGFHFRGKSPVDPASVLVYRYRLHGYDLDWHCTREIKVEYPQLKPGEYTFLLQAVDRDLNYSEISQVRLIITGDPHIEAFNEALRNGIVQGEFIGYSTALNRIKTQIQNVAPTELSVLVLGETGTGKGLVARAIHELSKRREKPFIFVNCGTLQGTLADSELFGHERGAFTGAISRKIGKFELADGGSIFLDEIGDLSLESQVRLLHVLQYRFIERVGGAQTTPIDVRVLAATNRDLNKAMTEGTFRKDLYYRLNDFTIHMPPLRERREDIIDLAEHFINRFAVHLNLPPPELDEEAATVLRAYDWPGNIRELEHVLQRAVILAREGSIRARHIALDPTTDELPRQEELTVLPLEEYERRYLTRVLEHTGGVIYGKRGAAALLGLHPNTLRSRMQKLGVKKPG